jgi:hypothetical protein
MLILQAPLNAVQNQARQGRRSARYIARRFLHFNSSLHRLRFCGIDPVQAKGVAFDSAGKFRPGTAMTGGVTVKATGTGTARRAGYGQLQQCGSVWSCPVCSAKINTVRAADLSAAVSAWHMPSAFGPLRDGQHRHAGGRMVFLTLTMRHKRGQELDDLWTRGISAGWGAVTSGRGWMGDQADYGVTVPRVVKTGKDAGLTRWASRIGYARVVETTFGANGWHVHIHALLFVKPDMSWDETKALADSVFGRWSASLVSAGFDAPTLEHGVDVKLVGPRDSTKVSEYFSKNSFAGRGNAGKLAFEASGGVGKWGRGKNRTPFQILEDLCSGEDYPEFERDLKRWWVWETASKGKRQLTWSPWLRDYLRLAVEETDDEIAAKELGGDIVLRLRGDQFDAVVSAGAHKLLDAVEADDDMTAAHMWLDENLGIWRVVETYGLTPNGDWAALGGELERVN